MARRAIVIGLDAMSPKLTLRFAKEGILPNIKKLMDKGVFAKALPCYPVWTPTNWTTIATGAYPGTHGIFMWGTHKPGRAQEEQGGRQAMSSSLCEAEYIWEAAARAKKKTVLFYFLGYPQTTDKAIHVDWFMNPGGYYFELCPAACYTNQDTVGERLGFQPSTGWRSLPKDSTKPLEARIQVVPRSGGTGPTYELLLTGAKGRYDRVLISKEKDSDKAATLRMGEWSEWLYEEFRLDQGTVKAPVRFKLVELSEDGRRLRLYRSQVYPLEGFTVPAGLARTLTKRFGPYLNEGVGEAFYRGWIDWETLEEEYRYQIKWIGAASKYLMESTSATLYFNHWHFLDLLQHYCLGKVDPVGGEFDPSEADEAWDRLRRGYALADMLVGELASIADEDTLAIVVSDHGNSPNRKRVSLVNLFLDKGWMHASPGPDGKMRLDPAKSKAFINSLHIYINLKGREPAGIVPPEEYESLRNEIVRTLRDLRDPADGGPAIFLAVKKEEAGFMGMWGEGVGDIIFVYSPGHAWSGPEVLRLGERRTIFPSGGANHGPQPPWTETETSSNYATLIMAGPGIRAGKVRQDSEPSIALVDLVPTICHVLGLPLPQQSQGRVLQELLEGGSATKPRPPVPNLILPATPPRKAATKFKGDVTDEA